ncbi:MULTISPECIES: lytic polysaccharide monooxygenase [Enterobacterales]|uniref:lytic polysaccharide monooxygenase n=1 Tax=Enterobacterales TaxID=91347 RepID=UPI001F3E1247|nr:MULTISPECIES: lytic polysaccharide monooxygenase [Enterobacterales]MCF1868802.1 lytic polysaccharide monooxygenase [Klebsiella pneumoniae]
MKKNKLMLFTATLLLSSAGFISTALADVTLKHGYIDKPPSRAFLCSSKGQNLNKNCGPVQYEPQSVEGLKGFPNDGPKDGEIASGGNAAFSALNEQSADRWHKVAMKSGENTFKWTLTAKHSTASWKFFITKPEWDMNKPLTRADFDLTPFCQQDDNGKIPTATVELNCNIPERSGYQVILGVWNIADTANAFYQVIDAEFKE